MRPTSRRFRTSMVIVTLLTQTACANLNSIYRAADLQTPEGIQSRTILIDAEQRAVNTQIRRRFVTSPSGEFLRNPDGTAYTETFSTICGERSPDTFSAQSGSGTASLDLPRATGALGIAIAESAASIALRTQLTQAQAELMYRVCEAYGNQAISGYEVHRQLRRFQNTMVALLAVEQLTGAVQVQNVALTNSATATTDQAVIRAGRGLDTARAAEAQAAARVEEVARSVAAATTRVEQANEALTRAQAAEPGDATTAARISAAQVEKNRAEQAESSAKAGLGRAEAEFTRASQTRQLAEAALAAAESGSATVAGGAAPIGSMPARPQAAELAAVADAVRSIVETAITGQQTTVELCHDVIAGEILPSPGGGAGARGFSAGGRMPPDRLSGLTANCWTYLTTTNSYAHEIDKLNAEVRLTAARAAPALAGTPPAIRQQSTPARSAR